MNFVSGYGSDSDGDGGSESAGTAITATSSTALPLPLGRSATSAKASVVSQSSNTTGSGGGGTGDNATDGGPRLKKKKILDISFLPIEIQKALARGDSTRDSDDDDDNIDGDGNMSASATHSGSGKDRTSSSTAKGRVKGGEMDCQLLGMLPAPKLKNAQEQIDSAPFTSHAKGRESDQQREKQQIETNHKAPSVNHSDATKKEKSNFNFSYSTSTKSKTTTATASNSSSSSSSVGVTTVKSFRVEDDDDDGDDGDDVGGGGGANGESRMNSSGGAVTPFFTQVKPTVGDSKISSAIMGPSNNSSTYLPRPAAASIGPVIDPHTTQHSAIKTQSYEEYCAQLAQEEEDKERNARNLSRKRKDRDMEIQLLSGNLSSIESGVGVKDISVDRQWDATRYTEQQEREMEIRKSFGVGASKSLMNISKAQSRKHQLNSLAMKAADTELALLEKKGHRMLTKSETQGKYGW